jgi:hypothetical protein
MVAEDSINTPVRNYVDIRLSVYSAVGRVAIVIYGKAVSVMYPAS